MDSQDVLDTLVLIIIILCIVIEISNYNHYDNIYMYWPDSLSLFEENRTSPEKIDDEYDNDNYNNNYKINSIKSHITPVVHGNDYNKNISNIIVVRNKDNSVTVKKYKDDGSKDTTTYKQGKIISDDEKKLNVN